MCLKKILSSPVFIIIPNAIRNIKEKYINYKPTYTMDVAIYAFY